jgi:fatty-acyl-CoA synthase
MTAIDLSRRNTIGNGVRRAAELYRERAALTFAGRTWSFAAIDLGADRVARLLLSLGLERGDRVGALGRNSDAYLLLWLGCIRAGLIHVPINYALTGGELEFILQQCRARVLFYQLALQATALQACERTGLRLSGTLDGAEEMDVLRAAADPRWGTPGDPAPDEAGRDEDLVQLLYTAGTTGRSKGAMMTHRAFVTHYASCIVAYGYTPADRSLAALPLYHSAQMHCIVMPSLLTGGFSHLIETPEPGLVLELIEQERITSFFAPPTVWIGILRHPDFDRRDLSSLGRLQYGASIMPLPVLKELRQRLPGAAPFNSYGQSEIGPLATVLRPEEHDARPASVGRPVLNVRTRVVDLEMRDCPPGVPGEIVHRSPQLLQGYWEMPEETARAFEGGWFHSGDIGVMDEDGYITVVDRLKDLINTGGTLVASREVEEALFTHPMVAEVAVIAVPDPKWIEAVTAVVVLREPAAAGSAADVEQCLIAHARERLAPFKVPKRVHVTEALPKSTAGKLLKRELRARYAG